MRKDVRTMQWKQSLSFVDCLTLWMKDWIASPIDWSFSPGVSFGQAEVPSSWIHQSLKSYQKKRKTEEKAIQIPSWLGSSDLSVLSRHSWSTHFESSFQSTVFSPKTSVAIARTRESTSPWGGLSKRWKSKDGEKVRKKVSVLRVSCDVSPFCTSVF